MELLQSRGHRLIPFSMHHPDNFSSAYARFFVSQVDFDDRTSFLMALKAGLRILYSFEARRKLEALLRKERPDIAHLHNIYHHLTPSILFSLKKFGLPVVMTLHDYKVVCPVYTLYTRGRPCEKCYGGRYVQCLIQRCHKASTFKSLLLTVEMYLHRRLLRSFELVDIFLSPSRFLKDKVREMGFRADVWYIPNVFFPDRLVPSYSWDKNQIVYVGRLAQEKGLPILVRAMENLEAGCSIIGSGPLALELERTVRAKSLSKVTLSGYMPPEKVMEEIRRSMFAVLPSIWYENAPYFVLEAFALGKPVVAARIGGITELVRDGETGFTFEPGNAQGLREKILYLIKDHDLVRTLGRQARAFVVENWNPEKNYQQLMEVYALAREKARLRANLERV